MMKKKKIRSTQVYYTTCDLAFLLKKNRKSIFKFMGNLGVPSHFIGGKNIYFLSDIQTYCPELLLSIKEVEHMNMNGDDEDE